MLRISKLADYAVVITAMMVKMPFIAYSATAIAEDRGLKLPTVRKVLKLLTNGRILKSVRGVGGGYSILVDVTNLSILTVVEAIDGPISLTECGDVNLGEGSDLKKCVTTCMLKPKWGVVNLVVRETLSNYKIATLNENN
jgi:FeS assembly SUF system regulator